MKKLLLQLNRFETRDVVSVLFLLFVILLLPEMYNKHWYFKLPLLLIGGITFFMFGFKQYKVIFWGAVIGLLSLELFTFYYIAANHLFVMLYLGILLFFAHFFNNDTDYLPKSSAFLLFVIMLMGGFQKTLSSNFMEGTFLMDMFVLGQLFEFLELIPVVNDYFMENKKILFDCYKNFSETPNAQLQPLFSAQFLLIKTLSWIVFLSEILFAFAFFIKNQWIKQTYFVLVLSFILITRLETGFIAMLSLLLLAQVPQSGFMYHRAFYILIYIACISLILAKIGLY